MSKKNYKETYFQHDRYARQDSKIKSMLAHFRNISEDKAKAAVCVFWWIVEDMHIDDYPVSRLDAFADDYRCDVEFLKSILEDFDLFRIENDCYVSDRVQRNLQGQEEKTQQAKSKADTRWLLSAFNRAYREFFNEEPVLTPKEIETLKRYSGQISEFKEKLRDILYTLKNLKFDTDVNFKPCANWLLKDNNLARLVNGEFGKLKHHKTDKEIKAEQEELERRQAECEAPSELDLQMQSISGKADALEFIKAQFKGKPLVYQRGKLIGIAHLRGLMKKFDITDKEIYEKCQH